MRKTIFVALAATIFSVSACAAQESQEDDFEVCDLIGGMAQKSMELILDGEPFDDVKAYLLDATGGELTHWIDAILIDAYVNPKYKTPDGKKRAVEEITSKWYTNCLELSADQQGA